ncbi:chloroplast stem-loop binding protein of 41 kDa b, chloroplastic-like isoform X2 [Phragmites australis]|uniref:chloroplast stem-loop binding protein of 41 kDa b, chloroplastic-like isoform X2 n=1 Tax=Phragmites australis TaxID=29695 RepID=UPI002D7875CC|nr:chloroplast stem-loop binding protein of 41 kDa b, chloroplastic-like isoform X2 [Phragmites australis]
MAATASLKSSLLLPSPVHLNREEEDVMAAEGGDDAGVGSRRLQEHSCHRGTRFIGVFLCRLLVKEGHQVTLFTRGKAPVTQQLPGESDAEYIYFSSAGVYLKSDLLPHREIDAVDPKSRHKGKLETESPLTSRGLNWTPIRPVYIYGPLNYNPVEEWFFHRLKASRPIPIPGASNQITQLGHVKHFFRVDREGDQGARVDAGVRPRGWAHRPVQPRLRPRNVPEGG